MTARRPLLTATAAGSVLFALWFVPSAHATVGGAAQGAAGAVRGGGPGQEPLVATAGGQDSRAAGEGSAASPQLLADTGGPDTTPYVIGGAACLALGAGLVSYSVRLTRDN